MTTATPGTATHGTATRGTATRGTARSSAFTELRQTIQEAGLLRRRYGYYWAKLLGVPLVFAGAIAAFIWIGDTWWQLLTAAVFGILFAQTAFLAHDAAHRQIFRSGAWNEWTSIILGDFFIGMSYGWWQHKHSRHHANPNRVDHDPDIELPVIASTPEQSRARRRGPLAWILAHQGVFFFPLLLLEGVSLHASGVRRVLSREPVPHRWVEITLLAVRLVGFVVLAFVVLSPGIAVAFLAVELAVFGVYMGATFAPNHKGMPIVPRDVKLDFLERQVRMSRNIRGGRFMDVLMGGLNYQVEHHLFPSMPRPHLRRAAPIVAQYCRERGVPYTTTGLFESYRIVLGYINRVGLGEKDPFECPLLAERRALPAR